MTDHEIAWAIKRIEHSRSAETEAAEVAEMYEVGRARVRTDHPE